MQAIAVCSGKVECNVSAKRMWRAACEDAHNCLPKALPQLISSMECEPGRGFMRPGSLRTTRFHESYAEQFSKERHPEHVVMYIKENMMPYMKERLQEVVEGQAAFKLKAEVVEGGFLGIMAKHYNYTVRVEEGANPRTCVVHWSCDYEALSDKHQADFSEALTEVVPLGFAGVESYLLAHDDVCAD